MYCGNCGQELAGWEKFCPKCGHSINGTGIKNGTTSVNAKEKDISEQGHNTVLEGTVHKCPNCGEIINGFTGNCPSCGHEFRGINQSKSVRWLSSAIESIEAQREPVKRKRKDRNYYSHPATKTDLQIVSLIRSFAIPNTKEDLYEFFVLAKSNIDMEAYDGAKHTLHNDDAQRLISDAWKAQFEQAYQKAVIVFSGDPRLERIKDLYETTQNTLKKVKKRAGKADTIAGIVLFVFFAIIIGLPIILAPNIEKKENKRLELIETNISIALEDEDYKLALVYADCLKYEGDKASSARNWKIKREYWIDRVIEEANEAGIVLARPKEIEEEQQDQEEQVEEEKQEEQENQDEIVLLPEEERAG